MRGRRWAGRLREKRCSTIPMLCASTPNGWSSRSLRRQSGDGETPRCAVLIDFVPISTGAAAGGYLVGDHIDAELCFYRSTIPLRAQVATLKGGAEQRSEPLTLPDGSLSEAYANYERAL